MDDPAAAYARVAADLTGEDGVRAGQLFGMPTLLIGRKAFAGYRDGAMNFKLDGDARREALVLPGATLFAPAGMGRAMKEWVVLPACAAAPPAPPGSPAGIAPSARPLPCPAPRCIAGAAPEQCLHRRHERETR